MSSLKSLCVSVLSLILIACGGGNSDRSSAPTGDHSLSGYVVNGPINNALVTVTDEEGTLLGTTRTNEDGSFNLFLSAAPPYKVFTTGGAYDDEDYEATLAAWCGDAECDLTPLTTLTVELMDKRGLSESTALERVASALGLSYDPFTRGLRSDDSDEDAQFQLEEARKVLDNGRGLDEWISNVLVWIESAADDTNNGDDETPPAGVQPYQLTVNANTGGDVSPRQLELPGNAKRIVQLQPNAGHEIVSIDGCPGTLNDNRFLAGPITDHCELQVVFAPVQYEIHLNATEGGQISPAGGSVNHGSSQTVTLTPDEGFQLADVSGCSGELSGLAYTTAPVEQACTLNVSFSPLEYQINAEVSVGGTVSPVGTTVTHGDTATFALEPAAGFAIGSVLGCDGSLSNGIYTTGAVTADCTLNVGFTPLTYSVTTAVPGGGGQISPATSTVNHGDSLTLTAMPDTGYSTAIIQGCNGSQAGSQFQLGPVTEDCQVTASFVLNSYTVSANITTEGGSVTPPVSSVSHGNNLQMTITPDESHAIESVSGCGGNLDGETYTTGTITGSCVVQVTFEPLAVAASVEGRAVKGVIRQGQIEVHEYLEGQWQLIHTTVTDDEGRFSLDALVTGPVRVRVSATPQTTMICELPSGCTVDGSFYETGEAFVPSANFELKAIYPAEGLNAGAVAVTPLTHLAAVLVEELETFGPLSNHVAAYGLSRVADLFSLPENFAYIQPANLANTDELSQTTGMLEHEIISAAFAALASSNEANVADIIQMYAEEFLKHGGQLPLQFDGENPALDILQTAAQQIAQALLAGEQLQALLTQLDLLISRWGENPIASAGGQINFDADEFSNGLVLLDHLHQYLAMAGVTDQGTFFADQVHQVNWLYKDEAAAQDTLGLIQVMGETLVMVIQAHMIELMSSMGMPIPMPTCVDIWDMSQIGQPGYAEYCRNDKQLNLQGMRHQQEVDITVTIPTLMQSLNSGNYNYAVAGSISNATAVGSLDATVDAVVQGIELADLMPLLNGNMQPEDLIDLLLGLTISADLQAEGVLSSTTDPDLRFEGAIEAHGVLDIAGFMSGGPLLIGQIDSGHFISPQGDSIADLNGDAFCQGLPTLWVSVGMDAAMQNCFAIDAFGAPPMSVWMDGSLTGLGAFIQQAVGLMGELMSDEISDISTLLDELDPELLSLMGDAMVRVDPHEHQSTFIEQRLYRFAIENNRLDVRWEGTDHELSFYLTGLNGGYIFSGDTLVAMVTIDWMNTGVNLFLINGEKRSYLLGPLQDAIEPELIDLLLQALQNALSSF